MSSSLFDSYSVGSSFYPKVKTVGNSKPFSKLEIGDTIYMYDTLKNKLYTLKVKYSEKSYDGAYRIGIENKSPITYYRWGDGKGDFFITDEGKIYSKYYCTDKDSLLNEIIQEQESLIKDKELEISNRKCLIEQIKKHISIE